MADLEKLDKTIKELEIQSKDLKEFNKVYSELGQLKKDISDNLSSLKEISATNKSISNEIQSKLNEFKEQIEQLENVLKKQIQVLYEDNKNFQKELDGFLITRLDKHKSDIQIEVRNEGAQIQRAFETVLNTNFNTLEIKIKEKFDSQRKQFFTLKILLFALIAIAIAISIGLYLK